jgi:hypothetical protein
MRVRFVLFGVLGAIATGFGVGLLVAPELLLDVGPVEGFVTTLTGTEPTMVGLVSGLVAGVYLGVTARSRPEPDTIPAATSADSRFDMAATQPPEEATTNPRRLTASSLDDDIETAVETGGESLQQVRSKLFETATAVYADAMELDPEQARAAIARGQWTRDPAAIAFLAGPNGARPPLARRVRLWLTPGRERRLRIERTIDAIQRVAEER